MHTSQLTLNAIHRPTGHTVVPAVAPGNGGRNWGLASGCMRPYTGFSDRGCRREPGRKFGYPVCHTLPNFAREIEGETSEEARKEIDPLIADYEQFQGNLYEEEWKASYPACIYAGSL